MKWAILTLISIFISWCCSQMLEWDASGNLIAHSYSIWGDWSAHFTFISNLMNRGTHWISGDNPVFYGMPFQYPFLSHLLTAVFAFSTQMDVTHATYYLSLLLLFSLPFILYNFFKVIGLSVRQSIIAVILFLFLGGLQGFDSTLNASEPLTNQFKSASVFTQIILFELFPQRAFLFGMILLLCGLTFGIKKVQAQQFHRKHFVILAIYFSLLSWMHLHSWIAIGAILLINYFFSLAKDFSSSKKNLYFGVAVAAFSAPLIYFLLFRTNSQNLTNSAANLDWQKWYPGWAQNQSAGVQEAAAMNPIVFWIYNTGIFLPLALYGFINAKKSKLKTPVFIIGTVGLVLFLIAELINIQPYFYDNLKLFTYAFLFFTPLAAIGIDSFFHKKILIPIGVALLLLQTYTASQDYLFFKNQKQNVTFLSKESFNLAEKFRSMRSSADSLVLNVPVHNHWVSTLTGNPIMMGYPGWLWTWGISYSAREAEINEALSGGSRALEIIAKYPIEYIIVSEQDKVGNTPVDIKFLKAHFPTLFESGAWHVFKTKVASY